jgi:predicted acylesterase/phospholipase RssA
MVTPSQDPFNQEALLNSDSSLPLESVSSDQHDRSQDSNLVSHENFVEEERNLRKEMTLIMKGGGVKGLAYIGAIKELQRKYEFRWYAGTSAGAITAVLLAAGYTVEELEEILKQKDFKDFFDAKGITVLTNLIFHKGLYKGDAFTDWLDNLLAIKLQLGSGVQVLSNDLPHRLTIFASSVGGGAITFDSDTARKGGHPFSPAYAARCSMSIPWVFTPQQEQGFRTYDGGLKYNYPIEKMVRDFQCRNFIGLYLGDEVYKRPKSGLVIVDLISIFTSSSDQDALRAYKDRTVVIDPHPIKTLDFGLTDREKQFLLLAGKLSACRFLNESNLEYLTVNRNIEREALIQSKMDRKKKKKVWRMILILAIALIVGFIGYLIKISPETAYADCVIDPPSEIVNPSGFANLIRLNKGESIKFVSANPAEWTIDPILQIRRAIRGDGYEIDLTQLRDDSDALLDSDLKEEFPRLLDSIFSQPGLSGNADALGIKNQIKLAYPFFPDTYKRAFVVVLKRIEILHADRNIVVFKSRKIGKEDIRPMMKVINEELLPQIYDRSKDAKFKAKVDQENESNARWRERVWSFVAASEKVRSGFRADTQPIAGVDYEVGIFDIEEYPIPSNPGALICAVYTANSKGGLVLNDSYTPFFDTTHYIDAGNETRWLLFCSNDDLRNDNRGSSIVKFRRAFVK